ncbi:MAG: MlaD family protein [Gemmatimonadota bacterium]|nr:MlaD family protein [Gemmatimonadota bacterium]
MTRRNEILTGIFVLVGAGVVTAGAIWLSGGAWRSEGQVLVARFRDVGQLKPGNRVTTRGVGVGVVETIRFGEAGHVEVEMRIRPGVPLPGRPVALLEASSLFGDWEASLVEAAARPDVAADTAGLPPGVIPGATQPEFSQLTEFTARIGENLQGITDRLDRALSQEVADDIASAVQNVNVATEDLVALMRGQREAFDALAEDVRLTGRTVRGAAEAFETTALRLDSATADGRLETILADARTSAETLRRVSAEWEEAGGRANRVLARTDSALVEATEVLARVNRGEGSLGRLTADTVLYENTAAALAELRSLLNELKTNPDRYFNFSIF